MKLVIIVDGGIVQDVYTDQPAEVVIVDRDTEGCDIEDLRTVQGEDAYIYTGIKDATIDPERVSTIMREVNHPTAKAGGLREQS